MLISLKVNNMFIYNSETTFSLKADMRSRRFKSNLIDIADDRIVKSAMIMGPNNVGKTNFIKCLRTLKDILLNNGKNPILPNIFSDDPISSLEVVFGFDNKEYCFEIQYDASEEEYIYEKYSTFTGKRNNKKEKILLERNFSNYPITSTSFESSLFPKSQNNDIHVLIFNAARDNLLIHLLNTKLFPKLDKIKNMYLDFAKSMDIIDMNNIPISKTIEMMKMSQDKQKKIAAFIKNADLALDDYQYLSDEDLQINLSIAGDDQPQEDSLKKLPNEVSDMFHLCSVYKGKSLPSVIFDSTGTKKLAALASYVLDALENNRILVVDELDNSLHFKLLRSVISLFNNELNKGAQLIFTAHDISLLDCRRLFRKEQIWFAHKDSENAYLYSLASFTSDNDGVRETSDLIEKYKRGVFGALPAPDLFDSLLDLHDDISDDNESDEDDSFEFDLEDLFDFSDDDTDDNKVVESDE